MPLFDAHNHLQHPAFGGRLDEIIGEARSAGLAGAAVNATRVGDWSAVERLAERHNWIAPQYGYHPWWVGERPADWRERLAARIESHPSAGIGEAGLDRWIGGHDIEDQLEVLRFELDLAASLNRPITLHCLKAWGELERCLAASRKPSRGFLIHACAAPPETGARLLRLGASFSFPGSFLAARKADAREFFRNLPAERLLVETDAPSLPLPPALARWHLPEDAGRQAPAGERPGSEANHPANIRVISDHLARLRGEEPEELERACAENFRRLFLL